MRVLVLGADSFVGRRLTAALAAGDWAHPVAAGETKASDGIARIAVRSDDEAALAATMREFDAVANCVVGSPAQLRANARALFGAAAGATVPPRIVHFSSMTIYGDVSGDIDERAGQRGGLSPYADAKIEAEQIAAHYPRAVLLRPGCEYGPGCPQWSERIARMLLARRLGDLGSAGDGCCNLLHIDDLIAAFTAALRCEGVEGQAFNLAMPEPPTWNEYFSRFARALGAVPVRRISGRRLRLETKLLAPPLKVAEIVAGRLGLHPPPAFSPSLARLCTQEIRLMSQKAEASLGLRWTPLDRGLREAARWFLDGQRASTS